MAVYLELLKVDFKEEKSVQQWNKHMQMDVLSFALGRAPFATAKRAIIGARDSVIPIILPLNLRLKQAQTHIGTLIGLTLLSLIRFGCNYLDFS